MIHCKRCGSPIPTADVDCAKKLCTCVKCCTLFDCGVALAEDDNAKAACAIGRARPTMPSGVSVAHDGGELRIRFRWRRSDVTLGYLLGGLGFMALALVGPYVTDFDALMVAAALLAGLAGIVSVYWALVSMVDDTRVRVGGGRLTVTRAPLPWPKRTVAAADVEQLYCMERAHRDRPHPGDGSVSGYRTFDVMAKRRADRDLVLVTELPDPEQALFLEQEIERALGIRDKPVAGELRPAGEAAQ